MYNKNIINQTSQHVKNTLLGESSGHDWWHIYRVWNNAKLIGKKENADVYVVELSSLLHDIADWKFHDGDDSVGPRVAREWLESLKVEEPTVYHVCDIIKTLSFKGANVKSEMKSLEGKVVQDADRLDAVGAVGIARAFAYGGSKGREMYNPEIKPKLHNSFEEYKSSKGTTVNHFYEKLLLLKDLMNTETAKLLAEERHRFMEEFLKEFYREWDVK